MPYRARVLRVSQAVGITCQPSLFSILTSEEMAVDWKIAAQILSTIIISETRIELKYDTPCCASVPRVACAT
jgi:hypothetical protein